MAPERPRPEGGLPIHDLQRPLRRLHHRLERAETRAQRHPAHLRRQEQQRFQAGSQNSYHRHEP